MIPSSTVSERTPKALLLAFGLLILGIVASGSLYYRNYELQYRVQVERQLLAVADLKVRDLVNWRTARLADGEVFRRNPVFSSLVWRTLTSPRDTEAGRLLRPWLSQARAAYGYDRLILLDDRGVPRLTIPDNSETASPHLARNVADMLRSGRVEFLDFQRETPGGPSFLAVLAPILGERDSSRPLGVLMLRIDPTTYLYPSIQRWPVPSRTSEMLMVRRDGNDVLYLNDLRFRPGAALTLRVPLTRIGVPAVRAVLGHEGIVYGPDYRQVPAVAAVRSVPGSPWFVVAKTDLSEAYAPLRQRLRAAVVLVLALVAGAGAAVGWLWRRGSARFYRARYESERDLSRAAKAERASEAKFRAVFERSSVGKSLTSPDGQLLEVNPAFAAMLGYTVAELSTLNFATVTHPDDVAKSRECIRCLLAGERPTYTMEKRYLHRERSIIWALVSTTLLRDEAGEPQFFVTFIQDITARKREEADLRRMATVVRDSNDAITIQDFEGRITAWNRGAELMYGYAEDEALAANIERLTAPGKVAEQRDFIRRLVAGEAVTSFETQRVTKDGRVLDVWMTVTKLMDEAGTPVGLASTERDITARKRAVEEIHQLNAELDQRVVERTAQLEAANKELEAFSYSVSHDLRAPLRHVQGYVDMLGRESGSQLSDTGRRYMKTITDASREMGVLIDDLLAFSRMGRAEMTETRVDLDALVREARRDMELVTRERNIAWRVPPLPAVRGDPAMLRLAFANLLDNAVKYSRPRDPAEIELGCDGAEDGRVILFVRDNGVGFDPQYTQKLFGVFQRLHRADEFEGTGIGLANVRRIIARHGGRTWAEGAVDKGATFYFTLRAAK